MENIIARASYWSPSNYSRFNNEISEIPKNLIVHRCIEVNQGVHQLPRDGK